MKRSAGNDAQQDQSIQQRKVTCSLRKQLSQATTAPAKPRKRSNLETPAASRGESSTNLISTNNVDPAECSSVYNNIYLQTCVREWAVSPTCYIEPYLRRATSNDDRVRVRAKASSTSWPRLDFASSSNDNTSACSVIVDIEGGELSDRYHWLLIKCLICRVLKIKRSCVRIFFDLFLPARRYQEFSVVFSRRVNGQTRTSVRRIQLDLKFCAHNRVCLSKCAVHELFNCLSSRVIELVLSAQWIVFRMHSKFVLNVELQSIRPWACNRMSTNIVSPISVGAENDMFNFALLFLLTCYFYIDATKHIDSRQTDVSIL